MSALAVGLDDPRSAMKCARCGRRSPAANWYCPHCGQALPDTNVSTAGVDRRGVLLVVALLLVGALGIAGAMTAGGDRLTPANPGPDATVITVQVAPPSPRVVAGAPTRSEAQAHIPATPRIVTATSGDGSRGASAPARSSPVPAPRGQPTWRIPFLAQPPVLDGHLDEWLTPPIAVSAIIFGQENWDGPADLSGEGVGGWDRQYLYLGVRVVDDVYSQPARGERLFLGDSLELQIDADRAGDAQVGVYNADDFQIGLSAGNFAQQAPEAYIWRPEGRSAATIRLAARQLEDGYIIEVAIPWRLLGFDPSRSSSLGIALNISDNDLPEPAQLTMVSTTPNRSWADPRSFGTLVLAPPGEYPAAPASQQGPPP